MDRMPRSRRGRNGEAVISESSPYPLPMKKVFVLAALLVTGVTAANAQTSTTTTTTTQPTQGTTVETQVGTAVPAAAGTVNTTVTTPTTTAPATTTTVETQTGTAVAADAVATTQPADVKKVKNKKKKSKMKAE